MRILLVQPAYNEARSYVEMPSVALLMLGTLAKEKGHEVRVLHLDVDRVPIGSVIESFKPDILGITVNTFQVRSARLIAQEARRVSGSIRVVVGGPHAGVWDGEADDVVVGEGENKWLELLGEHGIGEGIDDVPQPDYSLVDLARFRGVKPVRASPSIGIMASRGCPGRCTFCNTPVFWGKKVRYRSPELVVGEIEDLHGRFGVKEVFFQDDTFNLKHAWAMEIFERLIQRGLSRKMKFKCTSRADQGLVTKEFLDLAKRAGVWNIFYGVESGSQKMLDRMKKGVKVEEVQRAISMTHDAGIVSQLSFIVGLPGETWETLKETGELIQELRPGSYDWVYAVPFPSTEFDDEVTRKGHKRVLDYGEYVYGGLMARTDELSFEDLAWWGGML